MTCPACSGSGSFDGTNGRRWRCHRCAGTGLIQRHRHNEVAPVDTVSPAPGTDIVATGPTGMPLIPPTPEAARQAMRVYQEISRALITDADEQRVGRDKFPKRSAFQKLANAYRVSVVIVKDETDYDDAGSMIRARITARATHPDGRVMDGDGSCHVGERGRAAGEPKTEHDVHGTAVTRAKNRAIGDLIAFGAVSAEEAEGGMAESAPAAPAWAMPAGNEDLVAVSHQLVAILRGAGVEHPAGVVSEIGARTREQCDGEIPMCVVHVIDRIAGALTPTQPQEA